MSSRAILRVMAAIAVLAAVAATSWWIGHRAGHEHVVHSADARARYHCPMHPTIVSDRPGECPVCHMTLVPIGHDADARPSDEAHAVPGLAPVRLSERKRQLIGVKTAPVAITPFERTIRAVGRVTYDESRLHHVHTKVDGWVEVLHADTTGEVVRAGEPLLEIYSPELLATQEEYLLALDTRDATAGIPLPSVAGVGDDIVASARRRLELFDVTDEQIRELTETRQVRRTVTLRAPISGTIVERLVTRGERIEPGSNLLGIADLSRVWVVASIYEYELPFVREGQRATVALTYLPARTFEGRVSLVLPVLDPVTRTAQARIELANPDLALRPDMYAEVELHADLGERLSVPDTAVIDTGVRSVAFVDLGDGLYEPRELSIGLRLPDRYEVTGGLAAGERVVAAAAFFVDSESRLKAALAATAGTPAAEATDPPVEPPAHRHGS
jgi:Cu(I)/Ag(I) efflux system membrane fusion protein